LHDYSILGEHIERELKAFVDAMPRFISLRAPNAGPPRLGHGYDVLLYSPLRRHGYNIPIKSSSG